MCPSSFMTTGATRVTNTPPYIFTTVPIHVEFPAGPHQAPFLYKTITPEEQRAVSVSPAVGHHLAESVENVFSSAPLAARILKPMRFPAKYTV